MSKTTIGIRVDPGIRQRLDEAAQRNGQSLTDYIVSWLPIAYDRPTETPADKGQQRQRVVRSQQQSSPAHD